MICFNFSYFALCQTVKLANKDLMKTIYRDKLAYTSPNAEVYRGEYDGVLCVSYTVEIIGGGVITEDEDPWEPKQ